jgi:hypothetical protein
MPDTKNYNQAQAYHPAGCALFLTNYLQLYILDAAQHLIDPGIAARVELDELSALAVLKSGAADRYKDSLVDAAAIVTGTQPAAIFQQLLSQARTPANKAKVLGSRRGRNMAWSFKTPDAGRAKIAS